LEHRYLSIDLDGEELDLWGGIVPAANYIQARKYKKFVCGKTAMGNTDSCGLYYKNMMIPNDYHK
jgi:hypothetical protein